ncbi:MAG: hypothetical protein ABJH07_13785 [Sedimentitalea sp.]
MAKPDTVQGITCTSARPTLAAAILLACVLSVPVFLILSLIDWLFL